MTDTRRCRLLIIFAVVLFLAAGCGKHTKPPEQEGSPTGLETEEQTLICRDEQTIRESERNRAACYRLQPSTTITKMVTRQVPVKQAKGAAASKKGTKTAAKTPAKATAKTRTITETKVVKTTRCQPQCVIYARCRSGIYTCRLGDTNPVQWFACATKNKAASRLPHTGSVMAIATHSKPRIRSGHAVYVEEAKKLNNGIWQLRLSHANYDRKCHLDQDAKALFDPQRMTVTFATGHWARWAKNLQVIGFILR